MPASLRRTALSDQRPETRGDQRAEEILDIVRAVFSEKGFDGASMQDLARAAGMSAGNFYRYFPSKAALVAALVDRDLSDVEGMFRSVTSAPDPIAALHRAFEQRVRDDCAGDASLWSEIMAAAPRRPEIAETLVRMERTVVDRISRVIAKAAGVPESEAVARFGVVAAFIMMQFRGLAQQHGGTSVVSDDLIRLVLRTIDKTVRDAVADAAGVSR